MKKALNVINAGLIICMIFAMTIVFANAASSYNYGGKAEGYYNDVMTSPVKKTNSSSTKAWVNSNRTNFSYWFRFVDSVGVEKGYVFIEKANTKYNLTNSNSTNGNIYMAQAKRQFPWESGYVSGTCMP